MYAGDMGGVAWMARLLRLATDAMEFPGCM
jgi:hypothetical protein